MFRPRFTARAALGCLLGSLALAGCSGVYFNTTFNAEKAQKKALALRAERQRLNPDDTVQVTPEERALLQRSVVKSSKVLELWPDHPQYAPRAVYRIAESQYLMEDFGSAAVKYDEFLRYFPDHELAPMARVRLAQSEFRDGKSLAAREALDAVLATQPTGEVRREALLLSAQMRIAESTAGISDSTDAAAALQVYEQLLAEGAFLTPEARNEVRWRAAQLAWEQRKWEKARTLALAANEGIPPMRVQFRNNRIGVLALYHLGREAEGLAEVRAMQDKRPYRAFRADLKLLEARGVEQQGDWPAANRLYRAAVRLDPRSAPAAESWYRVGRHFLVAENREDSARAYFDSAASAGRGFEYGLRGVEGSEALKRLAELRLMDSATVAARLAAADSAAAALEKAADSAAIALAKAAEDTTGAGARADSLAEVRRRELEEKYRDVAPDLREAMASKDSLDRLKAEREAAAKRGEKPPVNIPKAPSPQYAPFMIAELFHFRLPQPDSARKFLERIVADTAVAEDSLYTRRALYALAWIEAEGIVREDGTRTPVNPARAQELYRAVLARYPATEWAKAAEINLGLPSSVKTPDDSARALLLEAERRRFAGEPLPRVKQGYQEVVTRYPGSPDAARAQFAIAFLVDEAAHQGLLGAPGQPLVDTVKAEYTKVRDSFMGTPQAERAGLRVDRLAAADTSEPVPEQGRGSSYDEEEESFELEVPRREGIEDSDEQDLY